MRPTTRRTASSARNIRRTRRRGLFDGPAQGVTQTSIQGLMTFKRMIAALEEQNYLEAARQMIDSRWGDRAGLYAIKLAEIMYTGHPQGWKVSDHKAPSAAEKAAHS